MDPITKIGFYNPAGPAEPMATLAATLEERRKELSGSLLVLPEAFNIGTCYSPQASIQDDPLVLCKLQGLCSDFDICVVAGLIIRGPIDRGLAHPYNSSYLIDGSGGSLLCHKMLKDNQGPYEPCSDGCDGHNATAYRNIALCSLICMDAYDATCQASQQRHQELAKKMDDLKGSEYRVMCVPAYIEKTCIGQSKAEFWGVPNSYRVVANSASKTTFPNGPGSFIERIDQAGTACRLVEWEEGDNPTCIKLYSLTVQNA